MTETSPPGGLASSPSLASLRDVLATVAPAEVVDAALLQVNELYRDEDDALAGASVVARVLGAVARERPERLEATESVLAAAADALGVSAPALAAAATEIACADAAGRLLPPLLAARSQLELLQALGGLHGAALWACDEDGRVVALCCVGSGADGQRARELAVAAIGGESGADRSALLVTPILRHGEPVAAVTARPRRDARARVAPLLRVCSAALAAVVDRSVLLERRAAAERILVEAGEHRLRRVGLDLHDGPLQVAAQLAAELKLLRAQVAELELAEDSLAKLRGRLDDLLARLTLMDGELRELAAGFESPVVLNASFETALSDEVAAFERRSGKRTQFALEGSLDALSPSQRIALYRMLQEALSNVRQHSDARSVAVRIAAEVAGVRAEIADDGVGFDPDAVRTQGGGRRHLGLAGIRERALLLGGSAAVESRPGGPSRVSIFLPASTTLPDLVDDLREVLRTSDRAT